MAKELTTLPGINFASCTSLEEVQDALSLMAKDAIKLLEPLPLTDAPHTHENS